MTKTRSPIAGSVVRAEQNIHQRLQPSVRFFFREILGRIRDHLRISELVLSAPPSEKWITVKMHPAKAVLAFRNNKEGNLIFDIDTYAHNDISDPRKLFRLMPNGAKPNKRHVAVINPDTPGNNLEYYIAKMIEGMNKFERSPRVF